MVTHYGQNPGSPVYPSCHHFCLKLPVLLCLSERMTAPQQTTAAPQNSLYLLLALPSPPLLAATSALAGVPLIKGPHVGRGGPVGEATYPPYIPNLRQPSPASTMVQDRSTHLQPTRFLALPFNDNVMLLDLCHGLNDGTTPNLGYNNPLGNRSGK